MAKGTDYLDDRDRKSEIVRKDRSHRLAVRQFLQESCELARVLPPHKKILFLLHYDSGFSAADIGKLCKVPESTVRSRLSVISNEINEMRKCCDEESKDVTK